MTVSNGQRASKGGLIITEATQVSLQGKGTPGAPGIHTDEQQDAWGRVVDAVHDKGGYIFLQLWHTGRGSHSSHRPDGSLPVAPSAIAIEGDPSLGAHFEWKERETPRALETDEITLVVDDYRKAALRVVEAGFDGAEIHSANGYLLDQFLHNGTNQRTDQYGGSIENRIRLLLEVTDAVRGVLEGRPLGVRLSPFGSFNDVHDTDPEVLFRIAIESLSLRNLTYLHLIEPRTGPAVREREQDLSKPVSVAALYRESFNGQLVASGGFTAESAEKAIQDGIADAIAFGRHFIANPDLPKRLKSASPLNHYDRTTFYGGGAIGYNDYPVQA